MSPSPTPGDSGSVLRLSSTAKKLQSTRIPLIKKSDDLISLSVCLPTLYTQLLPKDIPTEKTVPDLMKLDELCQSKKVVDTSKDSKMSLSRRISSYSLGAIDRVIDKRPRYERPGDYIASKSPNAATVPERKLDLTDDDVAFLISYNQLLRKSVDNDSSVLFTDEDFIKSFYKWDVESIKSSIARGTVKMQRIDSTSAFSFLKSAGVKKDIPEHLFAPLYDYYCLRWEGHQNLPVCRCSWVIIQQLNEYKNLVSNAKLA